ncbi:DUF3515 domain-containing protein [Actinokineospora globicatena]|uniref:DUF3515 domain-containing protein n=1 Tax=Actinokineospora globicatena TaxID=103729 RepID=UPI0020A4C8A0|nr:DUF3515 domain-containing protein [Actinokineospora globicatena]MCP2305528.1 Protein of unknown function (DUF3515) [Actinokineospora globicatena]GLW81396.1 hypothetical protein Aglo01_58770 [Actinokineospora globicatena]GLW87906.1 hypothetical protein Aglo02_55450 [Actinokineospora globicatena]
MSTQTAAGLSRTAVTTAAVLAGLLVVGVVVVRLLLPDDPERVAVNQAGQTTQAPRTGPVGLVPVDAPDSASTECAGLTSALPDVLPNNGKTLPRLPIADPAPVGAAAWGDQVGDPVVLRCGLGKPPELTNTAALREVSKVRWLVIEGDGAATWFAVDRPVYVALTLPAGLGTGPLQTVSEVVGQRLVAQEVRP